MNGVVNKTFRFELGGSAEYYINQMKEKFEYKEDEVFIMPDGTPIDPNLWLERRKWLFFEKKYHYNLNMMNTLARLVTIAALFKENKNRETVNSREANVNQFEQDHGNVSNSFFNDMFNTTIARQQQSEPSTTTTTFSSSSSSCPVYKKEEFNRNMREKKIQLDERLKVYLELEPHKKEFYEAEYQKALNSEVQEYHRLIRECERKEEIRKGKQHVTTIMDLESIPINNQEQRQNQDNNNNRPEKFQKIDQPFKPGPSKASVMGEHHSINNSQNNPFRNEQEQNINVDADENIYRQNNNNNNASSNLSTEVQTDKPYFHVRSEGELNKCVDSFYHQYEKEKQEKERLLERLVQLEKEKNDLAQMACKDVEQITNQRDTLQKIIDENNNTNENDTPSVCSSSDDTLRSDHSSNNNNSTNSKRKRRGRPTNAEQLQNEPKNNGDKSGGGKSMFSYFSKDKI